MPACALSASSVQSVASYIREIYYCCLGGPSPSPAVIYCHSGAFVLGNLDTDHRQCVEFARRGGCTVISVDYRLAPEHRYGEAVAMRLIVINVSSMGIPMVSGVAGSLIGAAGVFWTAGLLVGAGARLAFGLRKH